MKAQAVELQLLKQQKQSEHVQKIPEPIPESKDVKDDEEDIAKKKAKVIVSDSNSESPSAPGLLSNVFSTENIIRNGSVAALTLGAMYMKHVWKKPSVPRPEPPLLKPQNEPKAQQKLKTNQDF